MSRTDECFTYMYPQTFMALAYTSHASLSPINNIKTTLPETLSLIYAVATVL